MTNDIEIITKELKCEFCKIPFEVKFKKKGDDLYLCSKHSFILNTGYTILLCSNTCQDDYLKYGKR